HSEADVRVRLAIDAESEWIGEHVLVAVRRGVKEAHRLTLTDGRPTQRVVTGGCAGELDDRGCPAHDLLHGGGEEGRVHAEFLPFVGMLEEGGQAARHLLSLGLLPVYHDHPYVRPAPANHN